MPKPGSHCRNWQQFYMRWFRVAADHAWSASDFIASALGIIIPIIAHYQPKWESKMTPLIWEIPLCVFGTLCISRLIAAPYWIYKERHVDAGRESDELRKTIEIKDREIETLKVLPPEIALTINDVVLHRTGDAEWKWKNGEFLVQVSAELLNLPAAAVEYSGQLVFRGEVIDLTTISDVDKWEIIERAYYQQLYPNTPSMSRPRRSFVMSPAAITENLSRSIRNEGWLHFQIEGMGETDIAKRTLRLYATSKSGGGCHADEELAKHHVVRSDLVAMRKYIPTQP